jgi:hypothetical protein
MNTPSWHSSATNIACSARFGVASAVKCYRLWHVSRETTAENSWFLTLSQASATSLAFEALPWKHTT